MKYLLFLWIPLLLIACGQNPRRETGSPAQPIPTQQPAESLPVTGRNAAGAPGDSTPFMFEIPGTYTNKESKKGCPMELQLRYNNENFTYELKTSTAVFKGAAGIDLNEQGNGYYLTLKNIPWSAYEGNIDKDPQDTASLPELPEDITGLLTKDELVIQNTGNAMNYYVKFGDCDAKYIRLERMLEE